MGSRKECPVGVLRKKCPCDVIRQHNGFVHSISGDDPTEVAERPLPIAFEPFKTSNVQLLTLYLGDSTHASKQRDSECGLPIFEWGQRTRLVAEAGDDALGTEVEGDNGRGRDCK